jgi:hypothetical protein
MGGIYSLGDLVSTYCMHSVGSDPKSPHSEAQRLRRGDRKKQPTSYIYIFPTHMVL